MENTAQWVGIDVSKATLDVYLRPMGKTLKVANTELDISKLVEKLLCYDLNLIVIEATGGLETELLIQLQAATRWLDNQDSRYKMAIALSL